ncbi:MAG: hypothetical protein GEV04_25075 [Actinophytocola sp.]|nr:hypothetical protein [Actinophytocola sp.]
MTRRESQEDRVAPGLFAGAFGGLLFLAGGFVMALVRGPNPMYVYVSAAAVVLFALGIAAALLQRRKGKRHRAQDPP